MPWLNPTFHHCLDILYKTFDNRARACYKFAISDEQTMKTQTHRTRPAGPSLSRFTRLSSPPAITVGMIM